MTDRLLLRPVEYHDIDRLVALWTDPAVSCAVGGPLEREAVRERLDEKADAPSSSAYGRWPLIEKASGVVVGDCGLLETELGGRTETELSCMIARHPSARSYGAEIGAALLRFAFDILDAPRVIALVDPVCAPAGALVRDLGMQLDPVATAGDAQGREVWVVLPGITGCGPPSR